MVETAIEIEAPPGRVWPYLVDWENLGLWMKEGKQFRVTSPHREGEGVTATAVIRIGGISTKDEVRVTRWEPPNLLEIEHLGWVSGVGRMECRPHGDGTFVLWQESLVAPLGRAGAIGIRVFKPAMRRIFARDLRLLKGIVESGGLSGVGPVGSV